MYQYTLHTVRKVIAIKKYVVSAIRDELTLKPATLLTEMLLIPLFAATLVINRPSDEFAALWINHYPDSYPSLNRAQ